jgi:hypothetical protein
MEGKRRFARLKPAFAKKLLPGYIPATYRERKPEWLGRKNS